MDEITNRNKLLQKEVDKLTALLQLSERKRLNQKVLYDKNLENLYEKLADFENVLLKEQKEIQLRLQKKDQQIKVREDLARTLQNKLDNQFCRQCGYPTSKNKFDTDWELDISEESKKEKYRKLPPLSLPLPEVLPNVSFSNRLCHSKSKLSPVAEESEVASSSYLRNIHADQNQDRFHAVLTASLECLQVDTAKKNITPESEYPEEIICTPTTFDSNNENDFPHENKLNPRKLDLVDPLENIQICNLYQPPRPSIVIESCPIDDVDTKDSMMFHETISEYATDAALSVLEIVYSSFRRKNEETKSVKEKNVSINCIQSFSNSLAFGILSNMGTDVSTTNKSTTNQRTSTKNDGVVSDPGCINDDWDTSPVNNQTNNENNSINSYELDSPKLTNENLYNAKRFSFENHKIDELLSDQDANFLCNHNSSICSNGDIQITDNITEKPRSYSRSCTAPVGEINKPNYSRLSTMVVPLVDQAITVAKTIVRRRSSTSLLLIDDGNAGGDEKGRLLEKGEDADDHVENLSFSRRTLIELIDQAVEQVIPTVNCSKDNEVIPTMNCSKDSEMIPTMNCSNDNEVIPTMNCSNDNEVIPTMNCSKDNGVIPTKDNDVSTVLNGVAQQENCSNSENHSNMNGTVFSEDDPNTVDSGTLSASIIAENSTLDNKENDTNKSKKKKNKKKKKKKKSSVSDAGNRLPESVDQTERLSVNINDNGDIPVNTNNNGDIPVSVNDNGDIPETVNANGDIPITVNDNGNNIPVIKDNSLDFSFDASDVITSSLNNSETEINALEPVLTYEEDKFSLAVDQSFNEMEASRGSTPDTLDGFQ